MSKTLYEYFSKIQQPPDLSDEEGQMYMLEKVFAVRVKLFKDSHRQNLGTITHEITHIVQYILRERRIPLNVDTEEVYAYLTEDLLKKFLFKWY